jgi:two-component system, OmpR family, sensor kinase
MKRQLFWKILVGVWLMFFGVAVGLSVWAQWQFYGQSSYRARLIASVEQYERRQAEVASIVLKHGGPAALQELLATWPEDERRAISVREATPDEIAAANLSVPSASLSPSTPLRPSPSAMTALSPTGGYRLSYDTQRSQKDFEMPFRLYLRTPQLVAEALAGLLFSAALAWHLTRPLQRVRASMDRLASGDLTARLDAKTRRRRDEIGDLARDFDRVAARLEELVTSRERLLHEVSHECRSPLARIRVAIDLARQDSSKGTASFERIDSESRRLDAMIGDLLSLARAESGVAGKEGFVDVSALVLAVVEDARFEAQPAGIEIRMRDDMASAHIAELRPVGGDVELLRRTLDNVLRNAVSVSSAGQIIQVTVRMDPSGCGYVIEIADEGPGVAPEALTTMFQPFVRLRPAMSAVSGVSGFGLGLAIAKRAIELLGGQITARNGATGGLTVSIRLPFAVSSGEAAVA